MNRIPFVVSLIILFVAFGSCVPNASCSDKKTIIQQANGVYYSLRTQGLVDFECNVTPDWETSVQSFTADVAAREKILTMLKKTKFHVAVGPTGAALISHEFGQVPQSDEAAIGLRQIAEGLEQMISGFFKSWAPLMVNSPFHGETEQYQMQEWDNGYRFTADSEKSHAIISMNRDLVIDSIEAKTPAFEGTVHPRFVSREGRLILDGYEAEVGTGPGPHQRLSVRVQYQRIKDLLIPQKLSLSVALPQGQTNWPMTFEECSVEKK